MSGYYAPYNPYFQCEFRLDWYVTRKKAKGHSLQTDKLLPLPTSHTTPWLNKVELPTSHPLLLLPDLCKPKPPVTSHTALVLPKATTVCLTAATKLPAMTTTPTSVGTAIATRSVNNKPTRVDILRTLSAETPLPLHPSRALLPPVGRAKVKVKAKLARRTRTRTSLACPESVEALLPRLALKVNTITLEPTKANSNKETLSPSSSNTLAMGTLLGTLSRTIGPSMRSIKGEARREGGIGLRWGMVPVVI